MPADDTPPPTLHQQCAAIGWVRPSRRNLIIRSTHRVAQYYWIDFPHDAYSPEFWGEHPGIVVRAARRLLDTCIIVPVTSKLQQNLKHIYKMTRNPNPRNPRENVWAVCDHLYTVHLARLRPASHTSGGNVYPRADPADMDGIFRAIQAALPQVAAAVPVVPPADETSDLTDGGAKQLENRADSV